jgi:hypothetical protein
MLARYAIPYGCTIRVLLPVNRQLLMQIKTFYEPYFFFICEIFFINLKEITLILFKPKTGEALPLTAPEANSKTNPVQTRTNPQGPKGFGLPELLENGHMKVARLSNLRSGLT